MEEEELSFKIRGCVYEVFRVLGAGFLEQVYHQALLKEFELQGLRAESQRALKSPTRERRSGCMSRISLWRTASSWS